MSIQPIPKVRFGFLGAEWFVTDFIQTSNPRMLEIAAKIRGKNVNEVIAKTARYVAKNISYALDSKGKPTAHRYTRVFRFHGPIYLVDTGEIPYGWLMPNQCDEVGVGICFDTTALCCTLLRINKVEALAVMGAVLSKKRQLKGFHAWVEAVDKDDRKLVVETTSPKKTAIFLAQDIYSGKLQTIYDPICWFNEQTWLEDKKKAEEYVELGMDVLKKKTG